MLFQLLSDTGILTTIRHPDICANAEFQLDQPVPAGGLFELIDGQWFMVVDGELRQLGGRWTTNN